jgi:hypothetical protein
VTVLTGFSADTPVLTCGDFNLPDINWSIDNCVLCSVSTCEDVFLELYYNRGLRQFVSAPMRLDSTLDLVFCNDHKCILNPRTAAPFSTSDHDQLRLDKPLATSQRERICVGHNFKYANWTEVKDFLNTVDFYHLFNNAESLVAVIESFYDVIYTCIERSVSCKRIATSSRAQHIQWRIDGGVGGGSNPPHDRTDENFQHRI